MLVDPPRAIELFEAAFAGRELPPAFHPRYVLADAERDRTREPTFFSYQEGGERFFHGFLIGRIPGTEHSDIETPYGYGGPLATTGEGAFLDRAWSAYRGWCAEEKVAAEFIRFHPLAENWRFFDGEVLPDRQTVWIDLTLDDLLLSYETRARTAVRKARRDGLQVRFERGSAWAPPFRELYLQAMRRIGATPFYLFGEEYFRGVLELEGACLATCTLAGELVAAAIFLEGNGVVEYHLSAATGTGRRHAATNLLIHEMALDARQRGFKRLHLGGGGDAQEDNVLLFFKAGFSTRRASFRIGRKVHDREFYQELSDRYLERHGAAPRRVLFYRD